MNSIPRLRPATLATVLIAASLSSGPAFAHAINGAIYTSTFNHSVVNGNLYEAKEDVYLNGGPNNSQCNGGKLDDDTYYFQVTDPSGKSLLHNGGDGVAKRKFTVSGGVISSYDYVGPGQRPLGLDSACGSKAIRLAPFQNTPNNGGVYKVWITRVGDYVGGSNGCASKVSQACGHFGFVPGHTKTDNFKVRVRNPQPTGDLEAIKFYDVNANGQYDDGTDLLLEGWPMTLTSVKQGVNSSKSTDTDGVAEFYGLLPDNDYFVQEGTPVESNWVHSATIYSGYAGGPKSPAGPLTVVADQTTTVLFGNYCRVPAASGGHTLGFWSNPNGLAQLMDGDTLAPEFALLASYNLRDGDGQHFDPDPADYDGFRDWLLGGNSVYMGYMLSVQMAAMILNVEAGFVHPAAFYPVAGKTVAEILDEADASLASAEEDATMRAYRTVRKDWLDELNNGAQVQVPSPTPDVCSYTFD